MSCLHDPPGVADDELILQIEGELARRLREAAQSAGETVQAYAAHLLEDAVNEDWSEDERRFAAFERTGISMPADQVMLRFRNSVARRFASKG